VDLPRPRSRASRAAPEFQQMRDHVWDLLSAEAPARAEQRTLEAKEG
jgi:hypothetical protein